MSEKTIVYSCDGECFYEGAERVDEYREDWMTGEPDDGGYYTGEQKNIDVASLVPDYIVNEILDSMDQSLYDIVGEVSEDALSLSDEKKIELKELITNFMKENCSCSCWAVENVKYHSFPDESGE